MIEYFFGVMPLYCQQKLFNELLKMKIKIDFMIIKWFHGLKTFHDYCHPKTIECNNRWHKWDILEVYKRESFGMLSAVMPSLESVV